MNLFIIYIFFHFFKKLDGVKNCSFSIFFMIFNMILCSVLEPKFHFDEFFTDDIYFLHEKLVKNSLNLYIMVDKDCGVKIKSITHDISICSIDYNLFDFSFFLSIFEKKN
ncbi:hypothetical protein MBCUT_14750 [Methanobrevibacter cuticularis]|uniref:Uncharacterized protein n=1 Tax=Methanobrevibacter cuticularis TaxID=47311 RepID=A0A166DDM7_9EURY|nr:hypothetical protein MBCUT_14750 [Methanobrevibacter cuticularis]